MMESVLAHLAQAQSALGHDLHPALVDKAGNAVLSPVSIGIALAMTLAGAAGETRTEMEAVLHLDGLADDALDRAVTALAARISGWAPSRRDGREAVRLALATALAITERGRVIDSAYRARLRDVFAAELFEDADLAVINGWVDRHTGGLIPRILDRLDPLDVGVILAAVYLRADWQVPFDPDLTDDAPFALASGETVSVPMMNCTGRYAALRRSTFQAIRLPYADPDLAMIVVLPDAASGFARLSSEPDGAARLAEIRAHLDANALGQLIAELDASDPRRTRLALPRFTLATNALLADHLSALGMPKAFSDDDADLSGMTGGLLLEPPLYVRLVAHRATIEVAETGTRAAAVTAVVVAGRAVMPPPEIFTIDRPFLFFVTDRATGAVLFRGQVGDPRGAS